MSQSKVNEAIELMKAAEKLLRDSQNDNVRTSLSFLQQSILWTDQIEHHQPDEKMDSR